MKKCCKHEVRRYREALDLASCEFIHARSDHAAANAIQWAMERASLITASWRRGRRGSKGWGMWLPHLYRALFAHTSQEGQPK